MAAPAYSPINCALAPFEGADQGRRADTLRCPPGTFAWRCEARALRRCLVPLRALISSFDGAEPAPIADRTDGLGRTLRIGMEAQHHAALQLNPSTS
jgi:hypothetical protein